MNAKLPPFIKAQSDINFSASRPAELHTRTYLIPIGLAVIFLIFLTRLFQLTVVKGTYYAFIAENNRIREISIEGQRGTIYDRKGHVLAESKIAKPEEQDEENEEDPIEPPISYSRIYNNGQAVSHIIGYRQIASPELLETDACKNLLELNDKVGVKGVEQLFECHLRAIKGKRLVEVDSLGRSVKVLSQVEPKPGQNLRLSIDADLHKKAFDVIEQNDITTTDTVDLTEKKIAIVALDPHTGEVLMLFSYPTFDPQAFEDQLSEVSDYFTDKDEPLFNRALLGTYPPGSVFKPVVAAGALEEDVIEEYETIEDNGFIEAGPIRFHNWYYTKYGRTDGLVDLRKGLQRSNDIYFYKIGEKLTPEHIKDWAGAFGFGKKTGIDLPEDAGTIPSDFWKRETIGDKWYLGDTYNLSIGQGYLLTTPMQVAHSTLPFANDGKMCKPQILKLNADENKDLLKSTNPVCEDMGLAPETITAVREGMKEACESGGTGWPFFDFRVALDEEEKEATTSATKRIEVGCKTGTAESHGIDTLPHAWFTIFAPYDNPSIVLSVLVENGGEGSNVAAPIAKEILKEYFERSE